jgi:hypothetical protein
MIDPDTPKALKAIASMMRMEGYRTDATGVEALVLDNAADEIELLGRYSVAANESEVKFRNLLAEAKAENEKVRKSLHISHMYILSCQLWDDFDKYSRGKRLESK